MTESDPAARKPRILLVGAGHAHLHVLREAGTLLSAGYGVTVVDPGDFWYSGAATGVLAGAYPADLVRVDVARLAASPVEHVRDRVVSADPDRRTVELGSGRSLGYDVLSVNVGSVPRAAPDGADGSAVGVKPVTRLLELGDAVREAGRAGRGLRVVILGGGPSGCETALALERRARREGVPVEISLATDGELVESLPAGARRGLRRLLGRRGVRVTEHTRCRRIEAGRVELEDGAAWSADVVVDATGLVPPAVTRSLGLPVDEAGAVRVDGTLRVEGREREFAVGDCARFGPRPLARVGVHAVRQAPVLLDNLRAALEGRALRPYRPPRAHLLILALAEGQGLAAWGPFWWRGRAAFWLKDLLDRRFLRRHRDRRELAADASREAGAGPAVDGQSASGS